MAKRNSIERSILRADKETVKYLSGLKKSMGEDGFRLFVKKQYNTHNFFKKIFKQKNED